jgi:hypothetical protein
MNIPESRAKLREFDTIEELNSEIKAELERLQQQVTL